MTVSVANVVVGTHAFQYWIDRTNDLAYAMSTQAVTTDSNTAVGNAAITGTFTANAMVTNSMTMAFLTVTTSSANVAQGNTASYVTGIFSDTLTVGNSAVNTVINSTSGFINGDQIVVQSQINSLTTGTFETSGLTTQTFASFDLTEIRTAEYTLSITNNSANGYHCTKLLCLHNGVGDQYVSEYGTIFSNTSLGTFSVSANSSHFLVRVTPTAANTTIKYIRNSIPL